MVRMSGNCKNVHCQIIILCHQLSFYGKLSGKVRLSLIIPRDTFLLTHTLISAPNWKTVLQSLDSWNNSRDRGWVIFGLIVAQSKLKIAMFCIIKLSVVLLADCGKGSRKKEHFSCYKKWLGLNCMTRKLHLQYLHFFRWQDIII